MLKLVVEGTPLHNLRRWPLPVAVASERHASRDAVLLGHVAGNVVRRL